MIHHDSGYILGSIPIGGEGRGVDVTVTSTIPVDQFPVQIALTDHTAYVANQGDETVSVIDLGSLTVATTIPVGPSPWAIAVSPDATRAYVTNYDNDSVSLIAIFADGLESGDTCDWSGEWPPPGAPCARFMYQAIGLTVDFFNTSTGQIPRSSSWDFGDGCTAPCSTETDPRYTYGTAGTYQVTLTVTSALGIDSITKRVIVTQP